MKAHTQERYALHRKGTDRSEALQCEPREKECGAAMDIQVEELDMGRRCFDCYAQVDEPSCVVVNVVVAEATCFGGDVHGSEASYEEVWEVTFSRPVFDPNEVLKHGENTGEGRSCQFPKVSPDPRAHRGRVDVEDLDELRVVAEVAPHNLLLDTKNDAVVLETELKLITTQIFHGYDDGPDAPDVLHLREC